MALSALARAVLEQMDTSRRYDVTELRAFAPDLTLEALNEVMRELWVARQVERAGYSGWRREKSSGNGTSPARGDASHGQAPPPKPVKPEEMFDHTGFEGFFK